MDTGDRARSDPGLRFRRPDALLDKRTAYINNPLRNDVVALDLDLETGAPQWRTAISTLPGRLSWGPGVLVNGKLIQPVGPSLYTVDAKTGQQLKRVTLGGSQPIPPQP